MLLQCPSPPNPIHLNLIETRVGYLRDFMDKTCRVPLEDMTPHPTTTKQLTTHRTSTRYTAYLTTLLKMTTMDPTTPGLIIPQKSFSGSMVQPTYTTTMMASSSITQHFLSHSIYFLHTMCVILYSI